MKEFDELVEIMEESRKGDKLIFHLVWAALHSMRPDMDTDRFMGGMSKGHYKRVIRLARMIQSNKKEDNTTAVMMDNAITFIRSNMERWRT